MNNNDNFKIELRAFDGTDWYLPGEFETQYTQKVQWILMARNFAGDWVKVKEFEDKEQADHFQKMIEREDWQLEFQIHQTAEDRFAYHVMLRFRTEPNRAHLIEKDLTADQVRKMRFDYASRALPNGRLPQVSKPSWKKIVWDTPPNYLYIHTEFTTREVGNFYLNWNHIMDEYITRVAVHECDEPSSADRLSIFDEEDILNR